MDINDEMVQQLAIKTIMRRRYRFVIYVDAMSGAYKILLHNKEQKTSMATLADYDRDCVEKVKRYVAEPDREDILKDICIAGMLSHLTTEDSEFRITCEIVEEDGSGTMQQLNFMYIDFDQKLILITCTDITELIQKEHKQNERLKQAIAQVKSANEAKSRFLSRMSHDMRTPMNGIIGLTTLTLERQDLTAEVRQNMEDINESGKFLLNLINDTLDMSRIESNRLKLNKSVCNLEGVIRNITNCVRPMAQKKRIVFDVICVNMVDFNVIIDKMRVQQVFVNLLSNSVKFTKECGRIEFEIRRLRSDDQNIDVRMTVKDTGIGMSEQFLPKIFMPFEQEFNEITQTCAGSGLGMSIVRNLVELMGGKIEIESKKNVGTCITVYFEFAIAAKDAVIQQREMTSEDVLKGKRIMLCEDNSLNAKVADRMLKEKGIEVTNVRDGRQAVQAFIESEQGYYDMILMDVRMPVMNGLEATEAIRGLSREDAQSIPIIAMTANAYLQDIHECIAAGMNGHIAKPIEMGEMFKTIVKNVK